MTSRSDIKLTYHGEVRANGLHVFNRYIMDEQLQSLLSGKEVEITITKKRKHRSNTQNRFYWGGVIPIIQQGLMETQGEIISADETHEFLKSNFNSKDLTNESTGEVIKLGKSTTTMTTVEFEEYIERIRIFADTFLNVQIPEPNEQLEL